jgi:hypothetical protein
MMAKAPAPQYARAKAAALKVVADLLQPDGIIPDGIQFFNEDFGFVIRIRYGERQINKAISWTAIATIIMPTSVFFSNELRASLGAIGRDDFKKDQP